MHEQNEQSTVKKGKKNGQEIHNYRVSSQTHVNCSPQSWLCFFQQDYFKLWNPESILPDSYIHWSNRQFHYWISVLGGVTVYLSKSILKDLTTDWNRTSYMTLHTTKYAAHEFSMPFLWQQTSSRSLTRKDRQTRDSQIFLSVGWAYLGKQKV